MSFHRFFSTLFIAFSIPATTLANNALDPIEQIEGAPYVVPGAKVHKIQSTIVPDQIYEMRVMVPGNYYTSPEKEFPVIYVLDGQWNFTITSDIAGKLRYDGMIPDPMVVAITWGGEGDNPDVLRRRDFTATEHPFIPGSGGAKNFLTALSEEIIPFVDSVYRTNDRRILNGASLGGLFTTYAFLEQPDLFDGYIALAAPYSLEEEYFSEKLQALNNTDNLSGKRLYLGSGSLDGNLSQVSKFAESLENGFYPGLESQLYVAEGVGHAGAEPIIYTLGFQYVFQRPALSLSKQFLSRYAGTYEAEAGLPILTIRAKKDQLLIEQEGSSALSAYAETKSQFYVKGVDLNLSFSKLPSGEVKMTVDSGGNLFDFIRQACDHEQ